MPIRTPATPPKASGRRSSGTARARSSTRIAEPQVQRERRGDLAEQRTHDQRDDAADDQEEGDGRQRPAAADEQPGRHQGQAGRPGDHEGGQHQPELLHVEVVLALEHRQTQQQAAHRRGLADEPGQLPDLAIAVVGGQSAVALLLEDQQADDRQTRAGDQHQVGRAPQRDVLAEQPVPDVVEGKAEQCVEAGPGEQQAADGHVPALDEVHRRGAGLLAQRHRAGEDAAGEDAEQPEEDEVVRRVGQRAGVAADVDVQRDVPEHPEQGAEQEAVVSTVGSATHGGTPVALPSRVPALVRICDRRVRCSQTRPSTSTVRPSPMSEAMITSPIAAPPAGRVSAAASSTKTPSGHAGDGTPDHRDIAN